MRIVGQIPKRGFSCFCYKLAWEQRKFSNEFTFLRNNTLSRSELGNDEGSAFDIHYGDVLTKFGSVIDLESDRLPCVANDDIASKATCDPLKDGDVIIADTVRTKLSANALNCVNWEIKRYILGSIQYPAGQQGNTHQDSLDTILMPLHFTIA